MKAKKARKNLSRSERNNQNERTLHPVEGSPGNPSPTLGPVDQAKFDRFQKDQLRGLAPNDANEKNLAEAIATHRWFLYIADVAEAAILRDAVAKTVSPPITIQDLLFPEAAHLKAALDEINAPDSVAEQQDRALAVAFERSALDKIHKFRKEHERALDRYTKEWTLYRKSQAENSEGGVQ